MNAPEIQTMLDKAISDLRRKAAREKKRGKPDTALALIRNEALKALAKGPRYFLAYCALVEMLKNQHAFFKEETGVLIILVPPQWSLDDFDSALGYCFGASRDGPVLYTSFLHPPRGKKGRWDFAPRTLLTTKKVVILATQGMEIHPEFLVVADQMINLAVPQDRHLDALCDLLQSGSITMTDKEFLRKQDAGFLDSVFRKGKPAVVSLARLRQFSEERGAGKKMLPMKAFGEAGAWGLQLKNDLRLWQQRLISWTDVDRGILLFGPPGTGKSTFAASLASECDVHIVASSLAKWQSSGHLGDLLKAMYADFSEAKANAPTILFIDEFDAFGNRAKFSGDNAQYCTEVVNALLEAMDGSTGREGVIIVAASNYPQRIDPAFVRAGRLEKHVELSTPLRTEREIILAYYLPEIAGDAAIKSAAERLLGYTGADLEYLARRVRKRARDERRGVTAVDLEKEFPVNRDLTDGEFWRVCLHEAGHTVLAKMLSVGKIEYVEVSRDSTSGETATGAHGTTMIVYEGKQLRTETSFRAEIAMGLGGMAAELLFLGDRSTTSGGSTSSDLARATALAMEMVSSFGMGRMLHITPSRVVDISDPQIFLQDTALSQEVDYILQSEFARAQLLLESRKTVLIAVADALKRDNRIEGSQLTGLLTPLDRVDDPASEQHQRTNQQRPCSLEPAGATAPDF